MATTSASFNPIVQLLRQHKAGTPIGVYSVCSANPFVLKACLVRAKQSRVPLLIESTLNQVNQYGGYMGLTPREFITYLHDLAVKNGVQAVQLTIGGDHLGPTLWASEPAESAMQKACRLVQDYVSAGYTKIHLDASLRCADDPEKPLDPRLSAERAARLCVVAEEAFSRLPGGSTPLCYVIGTEVPTPGGMTSSAHSLEITKPENAAETIAITRQAFERLGLQSAWQRTVALVVQPGVEFGDSAIYEYERQKAGPLSAFIENDARLVFEAHSTDYQTRDKLRQMVEDHFAILKVGPALTFALREALMALEKIEVELYSSQPITLSALHATLEKTMLAQPEHWQKHYAGSPAEQAIARTYSFSDRIRYYWSMPEVEPAVQRLVGNMSSNAIPLSLLSAYLPVQYNHVRAGLIQPVASEIIIDKIGEVVEDYLYACMPPETVA